MTSNKNLQRRLRRTINEFARAEVDLAFKGCLHPNDHEDIELAHRQARQRLSALIHELLPIEAELVVRHG